MEKSIEQKSRVRELVKVLAGILITLFALYFFFKAVEPVKLMAAIRKVSPEACLLGAILTILSLFLRSLRFRFLLPDQPGADKRNLFSLVTIAFMINNILPARIGEAARAYLLYKKNRYSVHVSLGSLLVERAMDSLFFALFIVIPALILRPVLAGKKFFDQIEGLPKVDVMVAVRLGWAVVLAVLFLFLLYRLFPGPVIRLGQKVEQKVGGRIGKVIGHLLVLIQESTEWMFRSQKAAIVVALSPCIIICYAFIMLALAHSMGIALEFWPAVFTSAVLAFGVAVPSAPGYVGTLHLALLGALCLFGVDPSMASALAIVYHLVTWAPVVVLGLFFYFRMDVSFREMKAGVEPR